nr:MAG TPA: hypothetical protein [Caudoviricetes sp.]
MARASPNSYHLSFPLNDLPLSAQAMGAAMGLSISP